MHEGQSKLPALIKAGLLHVQFETIHPFLDGNGHIGRLLVTLYLCVHGVLRKPLLYLSPYFKTRCANYYRLLQEVRERGALEAWLEFFLDGVAETPTRPSMPRRASSTSSRRIGNASPPRASASDRRSASTT